MTGNDAPDDHLFAVDDTGASIAPAAFRDLLGEAFATGATMIAVPAGRLDPRFFDLRSGVAGDLVQLFVNYRMRLAITGELPPPAHASRSFQAFVREANRGSQTWFLSSLDVVRERLARERG